jgi:hypothetical protein
MMTFPQFANAGLALFAMTVLMGPHASRLTAQDTTVSATMLRVLAEAADVYRSGKPVFLVADYRYPHNVLRAFSSRAEAEKAKTDSGSTYGIFGPYLTPRDPIPDAATRIIAIRITTQTPRGPRTQDVDPRQADALFFSMSAIDKFVLPYYQKLLGPEYTRTLRQKSIAAIRAGQFIRHCWSWNCEDDVGPMRVVDPKMARHPPE